MLTAQAWGHALSVLVEVGVVAARARAERVGVGVGVGNGGGVSVGVSGKGDCDGSGGGGCGGLVQFVYVENTTGLSLSRYPPRNALRMAQARKGGGSAQEGGVGVARSEGV